MSYVEQIREIWESNQVRDLSTVLKKLLDLLSQAKIANEDVPLELEVDIVLNANYSFGFGAQLEESRTLIDLLHRVIIEDHNIQSNSIFRLACTASSSLITIMTSDTFNSTTYANDLFPWHAFDDTTDQIDILRVMVDELMMLLDPRGVSFWKLETISFVITYFTIINAITPSPSLKQRCISLISKIFDQSFKEADQKLIEKWKGEWVEKNDYCRFVTLMILNNNLPEDIWKKHAKEIIGHI